MDPKEALDSLRQKPQAAFDMWIMLQNDIHNIQSARDCEIQWFFLRPFTSDLLIIIIKKSGHVTYDPHRLKTDGEEDLNDRIL